MNCTIYRATFKLNSKLNRTLCSMKTDHRGIVYPLEDKQSHTLPLLKPWNYHFTDWEEVFFNFDPENATDWAYIYRVIRATSCHPCSPIVFLNEYNSNWLPDSSQDTFKTEYIVYKVLDENGKLVDTRPFIAAWRQKRKARMQRKLQDKSSKWIGIRHPHTANEMRQRICPEDARYCKEQGCTIRIRGNRKDLPTAWDDIFIEKPKCWKDRSKQRYQYKSKNL